MNRIEALERTWMKKSPPACRVGDVIRVHVRVIEGEKQRVQPFEGVVIGRRGGRHREMITVRKVSYGVGVERIFPIHSPFVERIEVVLTGVGGRPTRAGVADRTVAEVGDDVIDREPITGRDGHAVPGQRQHDSQDGPDEAAAVEPRCLLDLPRQRLEEPHQHPGAERDREGGIHDHECPPGVEEPECPDHARQWQEKDGRRHEIRHEHRDSEIAAAREPQTRKGVGSRHRRDQGDHAETDGE